ncbi:hypothetical protein [Roseinatronobacter sp. S2]|uniref:hypothetical protein n=1 Tax=Roseinatronobacter sp. S2 TaxID=3035471 RepID=UPI00240FB77C|nr:hypothetical protein [Roseinatronobacter sp. S2]WFE74316.1 hypothetical protein P8S53_14165 [Roseinatronobacter sp. S2]
MKWVALSLAGPTLWAVVFVAVYALHGVACAGQPPAESLAPETLGTGARMGLIAVWVLGLLGHVVLLRALPAGPALSQYMPRAGAWIGLGATAFTLFPVLMITSC